MHIQNKLAVFAICFLTTVSYANNNYLGYISPKNVQNGSITSCTIDANSALTCSEDNLGLKSSPTLININPEHTLAYIASLAQDGTEDESVLYKCNINQNNRLNNCSVAMDAHQIASAPAFNQAGNTAYILSATNLHYPYNINILQCPVHTNGDLSKSECRNSGATIDPNLVSVFTLTINPAQTFIYYTLTSLATPSVSSIAQCAINQKDGSLSNCHQLNLPDMQLNDVQFDPAGTHAYIPTTDDVTICDVNKNDGDFANCHSSGILGGLTMRWTVLFNTTGDKAYLPSYAENTIATCSVDQKNGLLTACTFSNP